METRIVHVRWKNREQLSGQNDKVRPTFDLYLRTADTCDCVDTRDRVRERVRVCKWEEERVNGEGVRKGTRWQHPSYSKHSLEQTHVPPECLGPGVYCGQNMRGASLEPGVKCDVCMSHTHTHTHTHARRHTHTHTHTHSHPTQSL